MPTSAPPRSHEPFVPRLVAWELTRACRLACAHCRAAAGPDRHPGELTTEEGFRLLENLAALAKPILILTGGEPLLRPDVYTLAGRAVALGLPVVLATCGLGLDEGAARRLLASGIRHISISLDGSSAGTHDAVRGVPGAFAAALRAVEIARRAGLSFQVNTTVARYNRGELPAIRDLAERLGAAVFNPFLLVPTGRGRAMADEGLSAEEYEETLHWLAGERGRTRMQIRVTCAPQFQRILRQRRRPDEPEPPAGGCLGGKSFAFVSHTGKVQICGFLEVECGDLRREEFDFR